MNICKGYYNEHYHSSSQSTAIIIIKLKELYLFLSSEHDRRQSIWVTTYVH